MKEPNSPDHKRENVTKFLGIIYLKKWYYIFCCVKYVMFKKLPIYIKQGVGDDLGVYVLNLQIA